MAAATPPATTPVLYRQAWYPLTPLEDLDPRRPQSVELLEEHFVIWQPSQGGAWRVFRDRCPHRLAPLSEGRLETGSGRLMCSYHGWEFDGEGLCRRVPQAGPAEPDAPRAQHLCATRLPSREAAGLLWLWPDAASAERAAATPLPISAFLELATGSPEFVVGSVLRDLPYDWRTLVENVADPAHVPFAHHGVQGRRERAMPIPLRMEEEGPERLVASVESQAMATRITFQPPSLLEYCFSLPGGRRMGLVTWCLPVAPGRSRIVALFPRNFAHRLHRWQPRWWDHATNRNAVLDGDLLLLRQQERQLQHECQPWHQAYRLPTSADRLVIAVRRWIDRYGAPFDGSSPPPPAELMPADPLQLLDRHQQHTRHCSSCRRALAWTQGLERAGLALFALGLATAVLLPAVRLPLVLLALLAAGVAAALRLELEPRFRARPYHHWRR